MIEKADLTEARKLLITELLRSGLPQVMAEEHDRQAIMQEFYWCPRAMAGEIARLRGQLGQSLAKTR